MASLPRAPAPLLCCKTAQNFVDKYARRARDASEHEAPAGARALRSHDSFGGLGGAGIARNRQESLGIGSNH